MQVSFSCCVFVKLKEVTNDEIDSVSRLNDFIGQFSRATKPRPQKLANFFDRMSSGLECLYCHYCFQYWYFVWTLACI